MNFKAPKNLDDCTRRDSNAEKITGLSNVVETIGKVLMWTIFICGLIIAIVSGKDMYGDFDFGLFMVAFIPWIIIGLIELLFYKFFAYLLMGVGEIVQNTRESANIAYYRAHIKQEEIDKAVEKAEYKNDIANIIDKSVKTCPSNSENKETSECSNTSNGVTTDGTEIKKVTHYVGTDILVCPYCGREQKRNRHVCYNCGKDLIKD